MNQFFAKRLKPTDRLRAREFMHAVGLRIFGEKWRESDIEKATLEIDPYKLGDSSNPVDRKVFVQFNILDALATSEISAEVHIAGVSARDLHYRHWCLNPANKFFIDLFPIAPPPELRGELEDNFINELLDRLLPEDVGQVDSQKSSLETKPSDRKRENLRDDIQEAIWSFSEGIPKDLTARISPRFWTKQLGHDIRNSAGRVGEGLDVRGNGGYVVAAGSSHPDGGYYTYAARRSIDEIDIATAPSWLLKLISSKASPKLTSSENGDHRLSQRERKYILAVVNRELERLGRAPTGLRNASLNLVSFKIGQLSHSGASDSWLAPCQHENRTGDQPVLGARVRFFVTHAQFTDIQNFEAIAIEQLNLGLANVTYDCPVTMHTADFNDERTGLNGQFKPH